MGALPYDGGVAFRLWAPHADEVWVTGDFIEWATPGSPLASEGNGNWYAAVPEARAGQEYKFVIRNGDRTLPRVDPYARQVTNSVGNGVIYDHGAFDWQGDDYHLPGHHELVIYELHIGSFYTRSEDEVGTLELAMSKFDHLVRLGVNVIQVMPVAEFAGDYSWGYNPAHVFAVESAYGGPDAFKTFVREAHKKGLGVVLDVVYNHFGPSDLDLWQFDGWSENDKGGIYFYNDDRSSTPWGDTRPDYGREEVRRFIHDNAMMWLHDYHVDGLRFDMTPYIRSVDASGMDLPEGWDLMRWINLSVREQFPGRITIAEDMHQDPMVSQAGVGGAAFHAQWDSAFVHPVREAVIAEQDEWRSMASIAEAVTTCYNDDAFQRVIYTESHDEVANGQARVPYEIDEGDATGWYAQKRSTLGAALALTSPGIPMLFQGQEFLQGGWFRDDVPLHWEQDSEFRGVVRLYRDLIRLRRNLDGTTRGLTGHHVNVFHADEESNVFAFHRWADGGPDDDTVVVVNLSANPYEHYRIGMPHQGRWGLRLNSDSRAYSQDFGDAAAYDLDAWDEDADGLEAHVSLSIAPYTVLVYSLIST
ncbi:MAG: alpha amylase C-terminal domain-containing protein [Actinomycetales bacterium]|nr:alpha amylase C-terminal domain-containing protein [Candidatus Lutibacillus vidarii]